MKTFKKYANLALLSVAFIATVPTYTMETKEVVDAAEQVKAIEPVKVAWYKRDDVQGAACWTAILITLYASSRLQEYMSNVRYNNMINKLVMMEDRDANIKLAKNELLEKLNNDVALYQAFPTDDLSFADYVAKRTTEVLASVAQLYEKHGFKNIVVRLGDVLSDGTKMVYVFAGLRIL